MCRSPALAGGHRSRRNTLEVRNKAGWRTKTGNERTLPLHPELKSILKKLPQDSQWCFPTATGQQHKNNLRRELIPIFKAAKLPYNLHRLRHTFASHLVMQGVDLPTMKQLMGHTSIQTTMGYAHLSQDHMKASVKKLSYGKKKSPREGKDKE